MIHAKLIMPYNDINFISSLWYIFPMWPFRNISLPYVSLLTKQSEISTKPYDLCRGETSPCCYDSE